MIKEHKTSLGASSRPTGLPKLTNTLTAQDYIEQHETLLIPFINHNLMSISGLDLSSLPEEYRHAFMKWLIEVNRKRMSMGLQMMITYDVIKRCPIWKMIPMPYKTYKLTPKKLAKIK